MIDTILPMPVIKRAAAQAHPQPIPATLNLAGSERERLPAASSARPDDAALGKPFNAFRRVSRSEAPHRICRLYVLIQEVLQRDPMTGLRINTSV